MINFILFFCTIFEIQWVVYTYSVSPFRMATFQVLSSDMWLVTAVLES